MSISTSDIINLLNQHDGYILSKGLDGFFLIGNNNRPIVDEILPDIMLTDLLSHHYVAQDQLTQADGVVYRLTVNART